MKIIDGEKMLELGDKVVLPSGRIGTIEQLPNKRGRYKVVVGSGEYAMLPMARLTYLVEANEDLGILESDKELNDFVDFLELNYEPILEEAFNKQVEEKYGMIITIAGHDCRLSKAFKEALPITYRHEVEQFLFKKVREGDIKMFNDKAYWKSDIEGALKDFNDRRQV